MIDSHLLFTSNDFSKPFAVFLTRPVSRKTIDRELPIFLNLLKVTIGTGLDLPQAITCLNQSSDTSCRHLLEAFTAVLKRGKTTNAPLHDVLLDASKEIDNPDVARVMKSLGDSDNTHEKLISHIDQQLAILNSQAEAKCLKLKGNFARRWLPHIGFFIFFVLLMIILPLLGPPLCVQRIWAIGPNNYGIPF